MIPVDMNDEELCSEQIDFILAGIKKIPECKTVTKNCFVEVSNGDKVWSLKILPEELSSKTLKKLMSACEIVGIDWLEAMKAGDPSWFDPVQLPKAEM